ncbi:hypothetical protein LMH73_012285 [Vibrio splendidus]|nr:hypothetical protein [Vibrio splendidus]MCC4880412.1 hypothetical protein [Vibrio splendidus]
MNENMQKIEDDLYHYYEGINFLEYNSSIEALSLPVMVIVSKKDELIKKTFEKDNLFSYYTDNKMKLRDEMLRIEPGEAAFRLSLNTYLTICCVNNIDVDIESLVRFTMKLIN